MNNLFIRIIIRVSVSLWDDRNEVDLDKRSIQFYREDPH